MDTLVAATSNGAKVLGVGDITGSLQAGKAADILVVAGNPLENIHELTVDTITMVMKDGSIIR
ncbi:MAG: amidohydrolase family protein [Firmicutes bacterium]|nr:amidohydrolase family protein [Bacillota bacterium]